VAWNFSKFSEQASHPGGILISLGYLHPKMFPLKGEAIIH
jgi:hypothetical protein